MGERRGRNPDGDADIGCCAPTLQHRRPYVSLVALYIYFEIQNTYRCIFIHEESRLRSKRTQSSRDSDPQISTIPDLLPRTSDSDCSAIPPSVLARG